MAEMTMNRAIHAAVRRDLARLEAGFRALDDGDRERAEGLGRAWDHLHRQLSHHHHAEDELIWPALQGLGVDATLLTTMEQEHQEMAAALRASDDVVHRASSTASRADKVAAAESLASTSAVVSRHLDHEETDVEPLIAQYHDSPEWKTVEKQLRKNPPKVAGELFAWLLDGADPEADRYVRSMMPRPVLFVLARLLGAGYQRSIAPVWAADPVH